MSYLNKYSIDFKGLSLGSHSFEFKIGERFFSHFESSDVKLGRVKITVELYKASQNLKLDIILRGIVKLQCDRCLEYFEKRIKHIAILNIDFGEENSDLTDVDETITLSHNESRLALAQHFYEYVHLSLPYKRTHKNIEDCNQDMIEKLKEHIVSDENKTDPRWDKLKIIYN